MHLNMVSFEGFVGSSTSVADIYIFIYHTKPQIEHDYLPHANANAFGNKTSSFWYLKHLCLSLNHLPSASSTI